MTSAELTNLLIFLLIGVISYFGKRLFDKVDSIEKKTQEILVDDAVLKNDINQLRSEVNEVHPILQDHEIRLVKLEQKRPL
jgi:hypothetical protein